MYVIVLNSSVQNLKRKPFDSKIVIDTCLLVDGEDFDETSFFEREIGVSFGMLTDDDFGSQFDPFFAVGVSDGTTQHRTFHLSAFGRCNAAHAWICENGNTTTCNQKLSCCRFSRKRPFDSIRDQSRKDDLK